MEFSSTSILTDVASRMEREWNYRDDHSVEEHILSISISFVPGSSCQEDVRIFSLPNEQICLVNGKGTETHSENSQSHSSNDKTIRTSVFE
jgi:hypothetical protein